MARYNMAMETLNIQQQYIGSIITSLNMLHFNDFISGAFGEYPELRQRVSPMLPDRDFHIALLYQSIYYYRNAVLTGGILTDEEAEIHVAILDDMIYRINYHYIPAGDAMLTALETGDTDKFAEALFTNFVYGYHLTGLALELRDRIFVFVDYVKDTMLYYDQIEGRIFNFATVIGISIAIFLALILSHFIQKQQRLYEKQIESALEKAKAASEAKTSFIANTSHEIRTPMNSIIGYSELAIDDDISDTTKEYLSKVLTNAKWLLNIINEIMDFSKIEAVKIEVDAAAFDINKMVEEGNTAIAHQVAQKGIKLNISLDTPKDKLLVGDAVKLKQAYINLLSNAVKFTNSGSVSSTVTTVEQNENTCILKFTVTDTGIGMTPEQIEKIFEPFVQANVSTTRKYGGTGLGLAIATNYISAMGGNLEVESTLGEGSKFSFQLTFDMVEYNENSADNAGFVERPMFGGEKVLVVEDNEMNQGVICEHLKRVGLTPNIALNGEIAVDMVKIRHEGKKSPFALIFMDLHMPVMDGIEATSLIRDLGVTTPIIATTAALLTEGDEATDKYAMNGYISKPFVAADLYQILLKFLKPVAVEEILDAGHDEQENIKLKQMFFKQNQHICDEIFAAVQAGKSDTAPLLAHNLKSNAGLIGETKLQKVSAMLEECLLNQSPARDLIDKLRVEFDLVIKKISPFLEIDKPQETLPDIDKSEILQIFNELEILLKNHNAAAINYIDKLGRIPGTDILINHLENFDMRKALTALSDLKENVS